jgi:hypothetical protein
MVWPFHHFVLVMVATKRLAFVTPSCSLWPDPRNTYQQEWNVTFRIFRLALAVVTLAENLLRMFENLTCKKALIVSRGLDMHLIQTIVLNWD